MSKSIGVRILLVSVFILATGAAGLANDDGGGDHHGDHHSDHHKSYSNASLDGTYVVSFHGWVSGGDGAVTGQSLGPQNGIGLLNADGKGSFTGTETANILYNTNGTPTANAACGGSSPLATTAVCTTNLVGTYSVNPDGTGTTTATATPVASSDCRCGPPTGFNTTTSFVMKGTNHLAIVGTDADATVIGQASRQ